MGAARAWDWEGAASPLEAAEAEFLRLAQTRLVMAAPWGAPVEVGLVEVRDWLLEKRGIADKDRVWREVIARARTEQVWMVGAVGLGMPGLRASARRVCRGLVPAAVDDVEAAILAGFITATFRVNTDWTRLAWRLRCRAQRAGFQERHRETREQGAPLGGAESAAPPAPWGHPDLLLAEAVRTGVIGPADAQMIAESRLENTTLVSIAADLGLAYKTLHKRRQRAEERLVEAIRTGELSSRSLSALAGPASPAAPAGGEAA